MEGFIVNPDSDGGLGSGVLKEQVLFTILCLRSFRNRADSGLVPDMSLNDGRSSDLFEPGFEVDSSTSRSILT